MSQTRKRDYLESGLFQKVREYYQERTALFGLIKWDVLVHAEKADDDLVLKVTSTKIPDRMYINGDEYEFKIKQN